MVKLYLRYSLGHTFGVITSANCNVTYDWTGKLAFSAGVEQLNIWNLRQQNLLSRLAEPYVLNKPRGEITVIERSPNGTHVAVGYSDGSIRLWNVRDRVLSATLTGHRAAVTTMRFNRGGNQLASGGRDTDIIVWDVISETGLFRLKGHRDQITDVRFLESRSAVRLVSSSKDTFVKFWDIDTQHCIQTLVGHRSEVWSIDVDPAETRLITAAGDDKSLRVFELLSEAQSDAARAATAGSDDANASTEAREIGRFERQSAERVMTVRFDSTGVFLAVHTNDRCVELFRVNSADEIARRQKKKKKKNQQKEDSKKKQKKNDGEGTQEDGESDVEIKQEDEEDDTTADVVSLQFSHMSVLKATHKVRSFAFSPVANQILLALSNNALEAYSFEKSESRITFTKVSAITSSGHRSDVRAIAVSPDDSLIATVSGEELKVWNSHTQVCIRTMESGYGLCAAFLPGNKHVIVGTKEGSLELYDIAAGEQLQRLENAHTGAVWSLSLSADSQGFVTGSGDKQLKFWSFDIEVIPPPNPRAVAQKCLQIAPLRTAQMTDDVLAVRFSKDGKYVAAALLDNTIKVFFADTMKFFLSLFGHKLPVMSIDISSDGNILVSGSADKNLKVWGMDFGDCRKSIFAHQDSIMAVQFVPDTHYLFSVSKDRTLKYWDMDKFELLLTLEGHQSEVWALGVSRLGDFVVTASHDRSLRQWTRTDDQFALEEAQDEAAERQIDAQIDEEGNKVNLRPDQQQPESAPSGKKTVETIAAGEKLIEAINLVEIELANERQYQQDLASGVANIAPPVPSPFLQNKPPLEYLLHSLKSIRSNDLDEALMVLPFASVTKLLPYLDLFIRANLELELVCRCLFFLLRQHHNQIAATKQLQFIMQSLRTNTRPTIQKLVDVIGLNKAALNFIKREFDVEFFIPDVSQAKTTKSSRTTNSTAPNKTNKNKKQKK